MSRGCLRVLPSGTVGLTQLTDNEVFDTDPDWSSDGKKITFESEGVQTSNPEGEPEIYTINADGTGLTNVTNNDVDVNDFDPAWSPDGNKIAFDSPGTAATNPEDDSEIYTINADGTGLDQLTANDQLDDEEPAYSPDGQKIAFNRETFGATADPLNPEGDDEVFTMDASDGSNEANVTNNDVFDDDPDWQPLNQCSDGVDNDSDSKIDFPDDPSCESETDDSESLNPPCTIDGTLGGDGGNDRLFGGESNDTLLGADRIDLLSGQTGNGVLLSGTGVDELFGGVDDDDRLNVRDGRPNDLANGGDGADDRCVSDSGDTERNCE